MNHEFLINEFIIIFLNMDFISMMILLKQIKNFVVIILDIY